MDGYIRVIIMFLFFFNYVHVSQMSTFFVCVIDMLDSINNKGAHFSHLEHSRTMHVYQDVTMDRYIFIKIITKALVYSCTDVVMINFHPDRVR